MLSGRIALGVGLVAGLVAVVGFEYLHGDAAPSKPTTRSGSSAAYRASHLGEMDLQIAYGSTPGQVLHQLGSPTNVRSGCWLYTGRTGSIRGRYSGPYVDAMKFCFSAGPTGGKVMTRILSHMARHTISRRDPLTHKIVSKQTYSAGWGDPITIIQPPPWYFQQSS